jgi:hypothetical protein
MPAVCQWHFLAHIGRMAQPSIAVATDSAGITAISTRTVIDALDRPRHFSTNRSVIGSPR